MEMRGRRGVVAVACALMAGLSAIAQAKVIYVDDDAEVPGDGSSWATAFTWLQHALAVAEAGDEIHVAQGFYRPDLGAHPESPPRRPPSDGLAVHIDWLSPYAVFQLKNGVALRGGFAGIAADDPNVRDERRYQTILSGDLNGNDQEILHLWGNPLWEFLRADNSLHVVESTGTDSTAVLEGFVIESAVESGLLNLAGSPGIANCIFRNNSARYADGGGLRCEGGPLTLSNCVFERNLSGRGGAVYAAGTDLTLADCHFVRNWAGLLGGAICCIDTDLAFSRCTFELNGAHEGGAIHQTRGALTLVECTLEANVAERSGGAVTFAAEKVAMTRCLFVGNRATGWAGVSETGSGGALKNEGTPLTLDECTFSGNAAVEGGAVYTLRLTEPRMAAGPRTTMTHCLLTGNRAQRAGGALYSDHVEFTMLGCTFAGNWAPTAGTLAWPGPTYGTTVWQLCLDHCIAWDGGESIEPSRRTQPHVGPWEEPEVVIRYSNVQGGWPGEGNIDADPCFAAPGYWVNAADLTTIVDPSHPNGLYIDGDYHLKSQAGRWESVAESWVLDEVTSPCIDAGDPNSPVGDEPLPNGGIINMGAYGGTAKASKSLP